MTITPNPQNDKKTTRDEQWTANADAVAAYHAEHGRWPSARSTATDERSLGAWLGNMRGAAKGGRGAAAMTAERIALLDALAPTWSRAPGDEPTAEEPEAAVSKRDAAWADRLAEYRARVESAQNLSTSLRNSDDEDEARLGLWLMTQRTSYRKGTLSADRIAAIEEVRGHVWDVRSANFDEGLAALDAYVKEHGKLPGRHGVVSSDPVDIAQAVGRALRPSLAGNTDVDEILIVPVEVTADQIGTMQAVGRALRSNSDFKLGHWVSNQRRSYVSGKVTEERAAQIDAIAPGWNMVDGERVPVASYAVQIVVDPDVAEETAA